MAPGAKYNGQVQLPDGSSSIIDKGKVDGAIDGTGKIFKVSDTLKSLLTVDIKVTKDKDGNIKMDYANFKSFLVSKSGDLVKKIQKRTDMSGHYNMTDKEKPGSSWSGDYNKTLGDSSKWKEKMNDKDIVLIPIPKDEVVDK